MSDDIKQATKKPAWYFRTSSLIAGILLLGPVALPLVFFNPHYSLKKKIIISVIVILFTILLTVFMAWAIGYLIKYYNLLKETSF